MNLNLHADAVRQIASIAFILYRYWLFEGHHTEVWPYKHKLYRCTDR